jgi:hypothetical protein
MRARTARMERGLHLRLRLPDGAIAPLGAMTLSVNRLFPFLSYFLFFLTLRSGSHVLRIPAHLLGVIFALGLAHVTITLDQSRQPYDGRAGPREAEPSSLFWNFISRDALIRNSVKNPSTTAGLIFNPR